VTSMPVSAPIASPRETASLAVAGPIESTVMWTLSPRASLSFNAASRPYSSYSLTARAVFGASRPPASKRTALGSGTCFSSDSIFTRLLHPSLTSIALLARELGLALLDERRHPLALVGAAEEQGEGLRLVLQAHYRVGRLRDQQQILGGTDGAGRITGDAFGQFQRLALKLVKWVDGVHQTDSQRLVGAHPASSENHLGGHARP